MKYPLLSIALLCTSLLYTCDAEKEEEMRETEAKRHYVNAQLLQFKDQLPQWYSEGELKSDSKEKWQDLNEEEQNYYRTESSFSKMSIHSK